MRTMRAQNLSIRLQEIVSLLLGGNIFSFCVDFNILQYLSITSVVHVMIGHWFHINESTFVRVRCFKGLTEQIIDFTKKMCSGYLSTFVSGSEYLKRQNVFASILFSNLC